MASLENVLFASTEEPKPNPYGKPQFEWPEYLVFSAFLALSVAIGIFYGFFDKKNQTNNQEYLLGGKKMHPFPVALSLLCSYVSSITLLGHPAEVYLFGTQLSMVLVCYIPLTISLAYVFCPTYFNLQMTSVYEYLEWRFNRRLRIAISLINVVYGIFFMSLVIYGPSLALSLVTGINHRIFVAVIFIVCIFYSSFGGFKAVLITDTLQAITMVLSMAIVVIIGLKKVGGFGVVWDRIVASERNIFFNFDVDPRTRHTFWTAIVGGYFQWLPMYANQAQIQRYISLPNMRAVRQALLINLVGLFLLMGLCYLCGAVMYATFYGCDPLALKVIDSSDQPFTRSPTHLMGLCRVTLEGTRQRHFTCVGRRILPVFVMETLKDYPGIPGLFVAGITSAGLSTVSSAVNALSASITEDYIKAWRPDLNQRRLTTASKCVAGITGLLAFGCVYIAELMGNIFGAATSMLGILGGPTFGAYVCGMFFPWCNTAGVSTGLTLSFGVMLFFGIGNTISNNRGDLPGQALVLDDSQCYSNESLTVTPVPWDSWKSKETTALIRMFQVSQLWHPALGMLSATLFGVLFSFIATRLSKRNLNPPKERKLFIPIVLKMWLKICPEEMKRLIKPERQELLGNEELAASKSSIDKILYEDQKYPSKLDII